MMPAAARLAVATSRRPISHGPPDFLTRRIRRVKPKGNRIIATKTSGRKVPADPPRREAEAVPLVPTVSVVVGAVPPDATVTLAGEKLHVTSVGNVPQLKFTVPVNPPVGVTVITVVPEEPLLMVSDDGFAASV
jgi:hypothetical protein